MRPPVGRDGRRARGRWTAVPGPPVIDDEISGPGIDGRSLRHRSRRWFDVVAGAVEAGATGVTAHGGSDA